MESASGGYLVGMAQPDVTPQQLHAALAAVAAFLARHDRHEAAEVTRAADEALRGDPHAAGRYLQLNRAVLDIYFTPANGNARDEAEGERLNAELSALHSDAFARADAVRRAYR
jgi:hypothetical protein